MRIELLRTVPLRVEDFRVFVLRTVVPLNCLAKYLRQKVMTSACEPVLLSNFSGVAMPLMMHHSQNHCHIWCCVAL